MAEVLTYVCERCAASRQWLLTLYTLGELGQVAKRCAYCQGRKLCFTLKRGANG